MTKFSKYQILSLKLENWNCEEIYSTVYIDTTGRNIYLLASYMFSECVLIFWYIIYLISKTIMILMISTKSPQFKFQDY